MTNQEITKYQARCMAHARRSGHSQLAEDFAQEAVIRIIGGRKATVDNLFIDFLRAEYGRTGTPGGRARSSVVRFSASLDAPASGDGESLLHEHIGSPERDQEPVGSDWRSYVVLGGRDATICELIFDDGLSGDETSELLAVSPSRISQMMKAIKKEIADAVLLHEVLPEYKSDKDSSVLLVDWISF